MTKEIIPLEKYKRYGYCNSKARINNNQIVLFKETNVKNSTNRVKERLKEEFKDWGTIEKAMEGFSINEVIDKIFSEEIGEFK